MATSFIPNSPNQISMDIFRSAMDRLGGPAKMCRFAVRILPVGSNRLLSNTKVNYSALLSEMVLLCESVEFPGRGMDFVEARYYGPNIQMPTNSKYSQQVDLTFICRTQSFERGLFDDWMEIINPSNTFDFNYLTQYESKIEIYQLSDYGTVNQGESYGSVVPVYQWNLLRAYPIQVHPQAVTWADQDVLRLAVSFSYRYWYRPGIDDQGVTIGTITDVQT